MKTPFSILDHLDRLTPDGGSNNKNEGSYYCPLCNSGNFKVQLSGPNEGKYQTWGCDCAKSEPGKQKIRDTIAPLKSEKKVRPKSSETYTYKELQGDSWIEVAQVRRSDDGQGKRKFSQWGMVSGRWKSGLPETAHKKIHLYKIDHDLNQKAVREGHQIVIVEGEGKVDRLLEMGIAATCSIGGGGKWRNYGYPNYLEDLGKSQPVICPDRDLVGIKHGDAIAEDYPDAQWLYPAPNSYLWKRLIQPDKGFDIADWIRDDGATREEILGAIGDRRELITSLPVIEILNVQPSGEDEDGDEEKPRILKDYEKIKRVFGKRIRFNELKKQVELDGVLFEPIMAKTQLSIFHKCFLKSGREDVADIIVIIAKENSYSPVRDYLDNVSMTHGDDTSVLNDLARRALGAEKAIHDTSLMRWLISCVARAYEPGCKVDVALIFQGPQGLRKSTFFNILASDDFFDDSVTNAGEKEEKLKLHLTWIVEWAELETVFKKKDVSVVKALMSSKIDILRPPYGRAYEAMKRSSVFCGTANPSEFLADSTGNRRFWVIPVTKVIDSVQMNADRDRIWAAAVALYRAGVQWWLTTEEEAVMSGERTQFESSDSWSEEIESFCEGKEQVAITSILEKCLDIPKANHDRRHQARVKEILTKNGWKVQPNPVWVDGEKRRVWKKL